MVKVLVKRLNSKVNLPEYKTSGSSGMDLMAFINSPKKIAPNTLELVPTGLSIAIPEDLEIQINPDQLIELLNTYPAKGTYNDKFNN